MSEILNAVITTYSQRPATAILMSGGGSNARTLLTNEAVRDLYDIRLIASDNQHSHAEDLASLFGLPATVQHVDKFEGPYHRKTYFEDMAALLGEKGIQAVLYAGFMKITTSDFCRWFPGVNVHPADLTIKGPDGLAKYRGMRALPAMREDLGYVASSMHVADTPVDSGSVIALTTNVLCPPGRTDAECHDLLKSHEHQLYPAGLILLGSGALKQDDMPLRIATL